MTGLPLNLFLHSNFAQSLSVSVREDGHYDSITCTIRRPAELDVDPPTSASNFRPARNDAASLAQVYHRPTRHWLAGRNDSKDVGYTFQWCRVERHRAHSQPHRGWGVLHALRLP